MCVLSVSLTQKYHYFRARSILHAAISLDGGCSWRGHREVLRDPELKLKNFEGSDHGVGAPPSLCRPASASVDSASLSTLGWPDRTALPANLPLLMASA